MKWFEWRPATERVVVTAGQWGSPNEKSLDDDRALTNALSAGTTKGAVIIDVHRQVPWQRVIDVVDAAHRLGRNRIEFIGGGSLPGEAGSGAGPTERPAENPRLDRRTEQAGSLQATEKSVMAGLEWLRRHQSRDGSWSAGGFSSTCDASLGSPCTGGGNRAFDPGVTGLAVLAFLGAGYDARRPGPYLDTVRNGLKHLKNIQDAEGCFGPAADRGHSYAHACITIAMCEAYESSKQLPWRKTAEQAVKYIHGSHNPGGGWRSGKQPGDDDPAATGWMLMALAAAKDAGIPTDETEVKQGLALLASITDLDTGRIGSLKAEERPARPGGSAAKWPPAESEALTALGICAQIFHRRPISPLWIAGADLLSKNPPVWDETNGSIAMDYWYWGTLTMFQLGDPRWERWNTSLRTSSIDHQVMRGCAEGSWDPKGPSGAEGGRVYSTALMTLSLETYYRYPRRR